MATDSSRQAGDARETKDRILNAAELLFAEKGFDAASLRDITQEAGANVAAVNYHFRSKDELIEAVFARWFETINGKRIALLKAFQANAAPEPASLEDVLRALIFPCVDACTSGGNGANFKRLVGRIYSAPRLFDRPSFHAQFHEMMAHFGPAFLAVLPNALCQESFWRIHFVIGSMIHALHNGAEVEMSSGGLVDAGDDSLMREYLVTFAAAALRAPLSRPQTSIPLEQWKERVLGHALTSAAAEQE